MFKVKMYYYLLTLLRITQSCVIPFFQNPDAWALMGHVKYMTNDVEASRDCYERTISFTTDAAEMHSIYLRLASIYLQEEKVSYRFSIFFKF